MLHYLQNKAKYGSFWSLFLTGISGIKDIKYCIMSKVILLILELILGYVNSSTYTTLDINIVCECVVIMCVLRCSSSFIEYIFAKHVHEEQSNISTNITGQVNELFFNASYKWHAEYPFSVQQETLSDIHHSYDNMMFIIMHVSTDVIDGLTVMFLAFSKSRLFCSLLILTTILMIKIKTVYNKTLAKVDEQIIDKNKICQLHVSNQWTHRIDAKYSPGFKSFYDESVYNPVCGLKAINGIWNNRSVLSYNISMITTFIQHIFLVCIVILFWYYDNFFIVMFIAVYRTQLFTFVKIYDTLEQDKNIFGGKLLNSFKMIDDACKSTTNSTISMIKRPQTLTINKIFKKVSDQLTLVFNDTIHIDFAKKGIILLDGNKGCGKSVTMDILAGVYDDNIALDVQINDIKCPNELRDLQKYLVYIRQTVCDDYKANKKRTVYMTLNDLFPQAMYSDMLTFLTNFDIIHKLPTDMNIVVSNNERGLSPGETQTLVLASQLWKALKLNVPVILLDEPERNIDYHTVIKIFDFINKVYFGTCIVVTHCNELKQRLKPFIKSTWKFNNNHNNILSFSIFESSF